MSFPIIAVPPFSNPTYNYGESRVSGSNLSSYTFSNVTSNATTTPYLAVVGGYATSGSFFDVASSTIGGVSGTTVVSQKLNVTTDPVAFLVQAVVTDTTPDVTITFDGTMSVCGIRLWSVHDLSSNTARATSGDSNSATISLDLNVQKNGLVIAVAGQVSTNSVTWVGATEDEAKEVIQTTTSFTSASDLMSANAAPLTLEAQFAASTSNCGVAAFWK